MNTHLRITLILALVFALTAGFAALIACGGGDEEEDVYVSGDDDSADDDSPTPGPMPDDDDTNDDDDDVADDDDDTTPDDDDDDTIEVDGKVLDWSTQNGVSGATVELLDNLTAQPFSPPITGTTNNEGHFTLAGDGNDEFVAVKIIKTNHLNSYQFNVSTTPSKAFDFFYSMPTTTFSSYAAEVGKTLISSKGHVMGAVQWKTDYAVGCATVEADPDSGSMHYLAADGSPIPGRPNTSPSTGGFVGLNINLGAYILSATVDGSVKTLGVPASFNNSIVWAFILYPDGEYPTNPTPDGCNP